MWKEQSLIDTPRVTSLVTVDGVSSLSRVAAICRAFSKYKNREKEEGRIQPTWAEKPKLVSERVLSQITYPG